MLSTMCAPLEEVWGPGSVITSTSRATPTSAPHSPPLHKHKSNHRRRRRKKTVSLSDDTSGATTAGLPQYVPPQSHPFSHDGLEETYANSAPTTPASAATGSLTPSSSSTTTFPHYDTRMGDTDDGGWAAQLSSYTPNSTHITPTTTHNTRLAQFSRPPSPGRVPDGVHVTLGAAPYDTTDTVPGNTESSPDRPQMEHHTKHAEYAQVRALGNPYAELVHEEGMPYEEDDKVAEDTEADADYVNDGDTGEQLPLRRRTRRVASTSPSTVSPRSCATINNPSVQDELEWMRNNLSHLGTRIDRLTTTLGTVSVTGGGDGSAECTSWTEQLFDAVLYLVTGVFVILVLDMLYRVGGGMG